VTAIRLFSTGINVFLILLLQYPISAQVQYAGQPMNRGIQLQSIPFIELEAAVPAEIYQKQHSHSDSLAYKSSTFGKFAELSLDPASEGIWFSDETGIRICRLGVFSRNASSLAPVFHNFNLSPGVKVFVYTPSGDKILGAYTFRNNNPPGILSVTPLAGDSIIIEIQVIGNIGEFRSFTVGGIGIGFTGRKNGKGIDDDWFKQSAACEVDINCTDNLAIQQQKYSVVRIIYDGSSRCTGTLVNNTAQDGKPYVLTAGHCIRTVSHAHSAIFYFDYESPYCQGPDGELKSVSGSALIARGENDLDFTLVELWDRPPVEYNPVYSGWETSDIASDYSYIIHQPEGDVKKITEDLDSVQVGTFGGYVPNTHWLIPTYETGSTEDGSSGAALFDINNRVIGTLSGGGAACSEYIYDYYQKFSASWDSYTTENNQLKVWLDPENTGQSNIDKYQPFDLFLEHAQPLSNINSTDEQGNLSDEPGWGYISGHNSNETTEYGEHFYIKGSKYIYAVEMDISHAYIRKASSVFKLLIRDLNSPTDAIIFQKDIFFFELSPGEKNVIKLDTLILVDRNFSVGYLIDYGQPVDTFAVSFVLPNDNKTTNTAYSRLNDLWMPLYYNGSKIATSLSISPLVFDFYLPENPEDLAHLPSELVTIYPNPSYDHVQILFKDRPEGIITIRVYDTSGRLFSVLSTEFPEPNFQMRTDFLPAGIFILRIDFPLGTSTVKLVKI
jgi:hypothetical protein